MKTIAVDTAAAPARPLRVVSVNTGLPRQVMWHGQTVTTGIFKTPVEGQVAVRRLNLDGDGQADLTVHGGEHKAVYCYPHEHYAWWADQLGAGELPMGMFGENVTSEGLDETSVHIGDEFALGTAQVVVTQPRMPCYKLGIRFQSDAMVRRFLASGRSGFYVAVRREGLVKAGDEIRVLARDPHGVSVGGIMRLYVQKTFGADDIAVAEKALNIAALPDSWKEHLRQRLALA